MKTHRIFCPKNSPEKQNGTNSTSQCWNLPVKPANVSCTNHLQGRRNTKISQGIAFKQDFQIEYQRSLWMMKSRLQVLYTHIYIYNICMQLCMSFTLQDEKGVEVVIGVNRRISFGRGMFYFLLFGNMSTSMPGLFLSPAWLTPKNCPKTFDQKPLIKMDTRSKRSCFRQKVRKSPRNGFLYLEKLRLSKRCNFGCPTCTAKDLAVGDFSIWL